MPFETPGADFRSLQILENTDRPPFLARCSPNTVNVARVLVMSTVRKIQPGDVHAQSQKVPQDHFAVRGRPNGRDDLGPTEPTRPRFRTQRKRARLVRLYMQCRNIARYQVELSLFQITSSQSERRTLRWRCDAPTRARFCGSAGVPPASWRFRAAPMPALPAPGLRTRVSAGERVHCARFQQLFSQKRARE